MVMVSTRHNSKYRKPEKGLWEEFLEEIERPESDLDLVNSFYCGDGAGREEDKNADDVLFAHNIGLKYYTPEMLFLDKPLDFPMVIGLKLDEKYQIRGD